MLSISQLIPSRNNLAGFALGNNEFKSSESMKVSSFSRESTDIVLFTQEGDKITISSESSSSSDYSNYRGLLFNNKGSAQFKKESLSVNSDNRFSMTVEGDLSENELKDINKALKIIGKIVEKLNSGDIENAMMLAGRAMNLESIAGVDASVEQEKKVIAESRIQTSMTGQAAKPSGSKSDDDTTGKINSIADKISDIVKSTIYEDKTLKALNNYISQFISKDTDKKAERDKPSDGLDIPGNQLKDILKNIFTDALTD
jgi:hypothetical protein